ncbi:MAG: DNA repair protein RadC [Nanoarchaeota archaeon]|nr:DNA repair protein RadC [Nanoarchaeota archaeon]
MKIKDIPEENRPRERFLKNGPDALSDAELLAVLLGNGTKNENVIDMANRLLSAYGIASLSSLSFSELMEIKGIGKAKAMQIKAAFELTNRVKQEKKTYINNASDVFALFRLRLTKKKKENFIVLMLDSKNKVIGEEIVSVGILDSAIIHPREIFNPAIKNSASKIILVHNHPSGDSTPSSEDIEITEKLIEAGNLLSITVLDHVIIGEGFWSYRQDR